MQAQQNKYYWGSDCRNLFQVFPKITWDKINFCHSRTLKESINDSIWPEGKQLCNKAQFTYKYKYTIYMEEKKTEKQKERSV